MMLSINRSVANAKGAVKYLPLHAFKLHSPQPS